MGDAAAVLGEPQQALESAEWLEPGIDFRSIIDKDHSGRASGVGCGLPAIQESHAYSTAFENRGLTKFRKARLQDGPTSFADHHWERHGCDFASLTLQWREILGETGTAGMHQGGGQRALPCSRGPGQQHTSIGENVCTSVHYSKPFAAGFCEARDFLKQTDSRRLWRELRADSFSLAYDHKRSAVPADFEREVGGSGCCWQLPEPNFELINQVGRKTDLERSIVQDERADPLRFDSLRVELRESRP